uniref:Uncharacterized protein n=1 Tax=Plectus sambesii TaxID=2011161 RepID=A0A914VCR0_9BILA
MLDGESYTRFIRTAIPSRLLRAFVRRNLLFVAIVLGALVPFFIYYRANTVDIDYKLFYALLNDASNEVNVCAIPHTDPWDATIRKYLTNPFPLVCKRIQAELTSLNEDGILRFNTTEATAAGYGELTCQYRCFDRNGTIDDVTLDFGAWQTFTDSAEPGCEFVEVQCLRSFLAIAPVYINLHNQILVRQSKTTETIVAGTVEKKQPNILLFVLDSVSQANWIRKLPETLKVLQNDYGSYVFKGFTKIGDNSYPNAMGFLIGKSREELPDSGIFDNWPLIWKGFSKAGYATLFAEDFPEFHIFNYFADGFRVKPTDHYFRPFWLHLIGSYLHRRSSHLCYGNHPSHSLQLNYLKQFLTKYKGTPKFALHWLNELGHEWLNQVAVGDEDLAAFFRDQRENLKDSFVFVFADHGHRFDAIRETVIGRIEERMPFFSMHVPEWLMQKRPYLHDILQNNTEKLASFYDLYVTLRDVLSNEESGEWNFTAQPANWKGVAPRGYSLLRPLPVKRTCEEAGIPGSYCVCQRETFLNVTDRKVLDAAQTLVDHLNLMLKDYSQMCAHLQLKDIRHAQMFMPPMNMVLNPSYKTFFKNIKKPSGFFINYRVAIEVAPSGALLEATLRNSLNDKAFTVIDDVNRINKYGNQSLCIQSAVLRKYCYCIV